MEYQKEKALLKKLKHLIEIEKDVEKQMLLISDYYNILTYLTKLEVVDEYDKCYQLDENISYYYYLLLEQGKINYCQEFINNFSLLDSINEKLLRIYNKYPVRRVDISYCNPIDINQGLDLQEEFFYKLGSEFHKLFNTLNEERRISFVSRMQEEGIAYDATSSDGAYILLKRGALEYDYEFLTSLAHEIGHCYEFYLTKENKQIYSTYLLGEVSSLFIEKLFNNYVINNHPYKDKALYSNMICQNVMFDRCQVNNYLGKCIKEECAEGPFSSSCDFHILRNKKTISLINSQNSQAIVKFPPSIENYLYVISDVVANNFVLMYQKDKEKALEEFKDFLLKARDTSLKENILKYGTLNNENKRLIIEGLKYQK